MRRGAFMVRLITTVSLCLVVLAACDTRKRPSALQSSKPPQVVALIGPPQSSPQGPAIRSGAEQAAKLLPGVQLVVRTPAAEGAASMQAVVRDVASLNPRVVCLWVSSPEDGTPVAKELQSRGALIVTMGTKILDPLYYGHVDANVAGGAEQIGQQLSAIAGQGRAYVLVHESGRNTLATQCRDRFLLGIEHQIGMTLLEEQNATESPLAMREIVEQLISRFENVSLVVTFSPEAWLGPGLPLGQANRFTTMPASPALWKHLRSGKAAALVGPLDGEIGSAAIELASRAIAEDKSRGGIRVVRCEVVTAQNLDDFASRYAKAAGVPVADLLDSAPRP
jgi:ABC-type sugar transport system substrate-binding protein